MLLPLNRGIPCSILMSVGTNHVFCDGPTHWANGSFTGGIRMKKRAFLTGMVVLCACTSVLQAQRVACVGDSITYGSGIPNRMTGSYPAQLGQMLEQYADQWEVRNFGVSGATLLRRGDLPYVQQSAYTQARQWLPDIVIIMLGTNDSKPQNWARKEEYVPDYLTLIDSFAELASHPSIWICKPVPAFQLRWGINPDVIRDEIGPLINEIASLRDVRVVDLYTPMIDTSRYFPDSIHPDATGSGLMAEVLLPLLTGIRSMPEFSGDGIINMVDYAILAQLYPSHGDVTGAVDEDPNVAYLDDSYDLAPVPDGDGLIGFSDFAALFQYWLKMPGLLAHWALDETLGQVAADSRGLTPGTVHGEALWQPSAGQNRGALEFDGLNDYIETGFVLNPGDGPFGVLLWAVGSQPGEVLLSQVGGRTWIGIDLATGTLMTNITDGGRRTHTLVSDAVLTDERWHEIGLVWDGTRRSLFVDRVEVAADTRSLASLTKSRGGLYIGAGETLEGNSLWTGLVDDIRIYDRALLIGATAAH